MAKAIIVSAGALSAIQDLGRVGYQKMGMPVAGVMDNYAARCANILVGNNEKAALIETALLGPEIKFTGKTLVALTGADMSAQINGVKIKNWKAYLVNKDDVLKLKGAVSGIRNYIAFSGGINVPSVMGSYATYIKGGIGGVNGRALKAGDLLNFGSGGKFSIREMDASDIPIYNENIVLRAVAGPFSEYFTDEGSDLFFGQSYTVGARSDRMGIFLEGSALSFTNKTADILSSAILMGSVQITNDATPVILMADRQTTGGYAQIATVISPDLPKAAQAKPGAKISFQKVSISEAQNIYKEYEKQIANVKEKLGAGTAVRASSAKTLSLNGSSYKAIIEEVN